MVELEIDGKRVSVPEGSMVLEAAKIADTYIPHFCYHKKLTIVANCRMCLVEIDKMPKAVPACATPVTEGMVVKTRSEKAVNAQQSVMEFLLINHPLDCPICDQGGECQLQDLAVGYGKSASSYQEEKRVVFHKQVGPLVCMEDMTRCIHCTRCVRFGQEIAGVMELGMVGRGEHSEITTFIGETIDSELSGNMIDLCPVGALTSMPYRFSARTWELSRRQTISPHDSLGSNLIAQIKNNQVKRVLPYDNESINECWLSDKDRFSYEGLNSCERLTQPMIKVNGQWQTTDWETALEKVVEGIQKVQGIGQREIQEKVQSLQPANKQNNNALGIFASPHNTLEELYLAQKLAQSSSAVFETRTRQPAANASQGALWLGMPISDFDSLDVALMIGANLRQDQPLLTTRLRQAANNGAQYVLMNATYDSELISSVQQITAPPSVWLNHLAKLAQAIALSKNISLPEDVAIIAQAIHSNESEKLACAESLKPIVDTLLSGTTRAVVMGHGVISHPDFMALHAISDWIATTINAKYCALPPAANSVGADLLQRAQQKIEQVSNTSQAIQANQHTTFFDQSRAAYILLGTEPEFDYFDPANALNRLHHAEFVVSLTAFIPASVTRELESQKVAQASQSNAVNGSNTHDLIADDKSHNHSQSFINFNQQNLSLTDLGLASNTKIIKEIPQENDQQGVTRSYIDVLLPITPFTETAGTFINLAGSVQSFQGVVRPLGESRPAWKVLRVLGNLLGYPNFDFDSADAVKETALKTIDCEHGLNNQASPAALSALKLVAKNLAAKSSATECDKPTQSAFSVDGHEKKLSLERIADVPIYHADPIVRRARSLQNTTTAKQAQYAGLSPAAFDHLQLNVNSLIKITQGEHSTIVKARRDEILPDGVIRLNAAIVAAAQLGAAPSQVIVEKWEQA